MAYFVLSVAGGMLALGAKESVDEQKYLKLGADISHTCHESYDRSGGLTQREKERQGEREKGEETE